MSKKARRLTFAAPEDLLYYEGVVSVSGGGGGGPPTLPPPIVEPLVDLPPIPNVARSPK
jgi:hypothetical protein